MAERLDSQAAAVGTAAARLDSQVAAVGTAAALVDSLAAQEGRRIQVVAGTGLTKRMRHGNENAKRQGFSSYIWLDFPPT